MATHQPLLENPKTSHYKTFYLFLTFTAIISSIALVATHFIRPSSSNPFLQSHICDQEGWIDTDTIMQMNDVHLLQVFLERSTSAIQKAMDTANNVNQRINNNPREQAALLDCMELMDLSKDRVFDSIVALKNMTTRSFEDAHAWLSSVLTNHVTCLDGLEGSDSAWTSMEPGLKDLLSRAKTSLAMLVAISPMKTKVMIDEPLYGEFPSWVTGSDRRLLQALPKEIKANVVVAKDGSGKYKTVKEAVASAPNNGKTRYVIYVKKGTYKENVEVGKSKKNVMIVGDGMDSTIITGSLNVVDGSTTFNSATVGKDPSFICQDLKYIIIIIIIIYYLYSIVTIMKKRFEP
jgi:pectinesterase